MFNNDKRGITAIEYGIIASLIGIVCLTYMGNVGQQNKKIFCDIASAFSESTNCSTSNTSANSVSSETTAKNNSGINESLYNSLSKNEKGLADLMVKQMNEAIEAKALFSKGSADIKKYYGLAQEDASNENYDKSNEDYVLMDGGYTEQNNARNDWNQVITYENQIQAYKWNLYSQYNGDENKVQASMDKAAKSVNYIDPTANGGSVDN